MNEARAGTWRTSRRGASALRFERGSRAHNADEIMAEIVAKGLVQYLERAGFVVMKRPAIGNGTGVGRGFDG